MKNKTSQISGFHKKTHDQRLEMLEQFSDLSEEEILLLKVTSSFDFDLANRMVENVISSIQIPLGVATNFLINKKEYFVPMATEESSVIAAASLGAKLARETGGFQVEAAEPIMIGQIQLKSLKDFDLAEKIILEHKQELLALASSCDPVLIGVGGGAREIECRVLETPRGQMLLIHLLVDVRDAMGANIVNTMAEKIAPELERLTGGKVGLRIVSNLSSHRMVKARAVWSKEIIREFVLEEILDAHALAQADPFRCATHNKGVMNGIDAVALATGNDFRAIEAGAHAWAANKPLTRYHKNKDGNLVGELEMPLAVGIVGGVTQYHPMAKLSLKILGVSSSQELACVMGAVGLAQNFAALRALVSEGICQGHMRLHKQKNL